MRMGSNSFIRCAIPGRYVLPGTYILALARKTRGHPHYSIDPSTCRPQQEYYVDTSTAEISRYVHAQAAESINGRNHPARTLSRLRASRSYSSTWYMFFMCLNHEVQSLVLRRFLYLRTQLNSPSASGHKRRGSGRHATTRICPYERKGRCDARCPRFRVRCPVATHEPTLPRMNPV